MRYLFAILLLVVARPAFSNDWTVVSTSPGVTGVVGVSENDLTLGTPWDPDAADMCATEYDVRCEWMVAHTGDDLEHQANGVLAATFDGSAANQNAVFVSDLWSDQVSGPSPWWVRYDVHYIAVDPADIPSLRLISRYKHAGVTRLTLSLTGLATADRVQFRNAPLHVWTDTPETGDSWTLELTATCTTTGLPAMIWVDNILVTEGATTLYEEDFPAGTTDVGDEHVIRVVQPLAAFPNPLRGATTLRFEAPDTGPVAIGVYSVTGRLVRSLISQSLSAGPQLVRWDGNDANGNAAPSGSYVIQLNRGGENHSTKVVKLD